MIAPQTLAKTPVLSSCRVLLLQNEVRPATNLAAARIARAGGAQIILNAAPMRDLPPELAELVDILVVNEIEAEQPCRSGVIDGFDSAERAARDLLALVPTVLLTLGSQGLLIATRDGTLLGIPGHKVVMHSTHGAGDCLIGALAACLVKGGTLAEAAHHANAAAAVLVSTPEVERRTLTSNATTQFLGR